jgi:hypothetical protein
MAQTGQGSTRDADPSAANLYKTNFTVNAVGIVIILIVAVGAFYLLQPRAPKQP